MHGMANRELGEGLLETPGRLGHLRGGLPQSQLALESTQ